ncbi:MAG TPA: cysteine--tRNA ligase [Acidimicrobiales bacterium]|nr:cysteine--tRNA ligase [Acidimicrobiales bacterium]
MMRLYDTARQEITTFDPAAGPGGTVTLYTCGVTPYDAAHLGHAATYIAYDVAQRRMRDLGYKTRLVRNVTDVDDDILRKARELGVYYLDLADQEMEAFSADMDALGLLPAASEPRATSAIQDIQTLIAAVLANGHAYRAGGGVYFDIASWPAFGSVSHYGRDEMTRLAKERGGNPDDPNKRSPLDFVLWQPSAQGEPAWDSDWGAGRPGWHVECSALAMRELDQTIDLHGGGSDLIFPHHECEAALSGAVTGEPFVRHWVHTGMVGYEGTKMSKSLGNLVFVRDLLKSWEPAVIRLAVLAHHYRSDWEWQDEDVREAAKRLALWRTGKEQAPAAEVPGPGRDPVDAGVLDAVRARLDDDLDTSGALAAIDAATASPRAGATQADISSAAALLGLVL